MANTVSDALRDAVSRLATAGHPASDAEELLSRLLGVGRGELLKLSARPLETSEAAEFDGQLRRRKAGEPVQYITGRAAFRHLDLAVDRRVLIPRPETELLVEAVLEHLDALDWSQRPPRVLDLGTGSGCIALAIAQERRDALVTATDARRTPWPGARERGRVWCRRPRACARALVRSWIRRRARRRRETALHLVRRAAALPADVREWEPPPLFADDEGLADRARSSRRLLATPAAGGLLALELAEMRARDVAAWLEGAHDWSGVDLRDDLAGRPRMLLARRERGPAIAPAQWGEDG
jgi:release factor glutamine methyltransferase